MYGFEGFDEIIERCLLDCELGAVAQILIEERQRENEDDRPEQAAA